MQGDNNLCWAYCMVMRNSYDSGIVLTSAEADSEAKALGEKYHPIIGWNHSLPFPKQGKREYLTSEISYRDLALQEGILNSSTIVRWVNQYQAAGPDALRPKKKGRKRSMDKEKIMRDIETGDTEEQKELLKQLQEENLKLRIENAFLKELRRLRLEEQARLNEQRESSTASGENSN